MSQSRATSGLRPHNRPRWRGLWPVAVVASLALIPAFGRPRVAEGQEELAGALSAGDRWSEMINLPAGSSTTMADCRSCHVMSQSDAHPVDVRPRRVIHASLPLKDGQLTCTTCHESSQAAHRRAKSTGGKMLRPLLSDGHSCSTCHGDQGEDQRMRHAVAIGKAHHPVQEGRRGRASKSQIGLDTESRTCMGCHDGSLGKGLGVSHPVGVPYDDVAWAASGSRSRLTDRNRLDRNIRLFGGNIGCGSCHNAYSSTAKMLSKPNTRGQLCTSCHLNR